jgi:hypothetical protein
MNTPDDTPLDLDAIEADLPSGDPTQPATFQLATAGHHVRPLLAEARRLRAEVAGLRAERDAAQNALDAARQSRSPRPGEPCPGCGRTDFAHEQRCPDLAASILSHQLQLARADLRAAEADRERLEAYWRAAARERDTAFAVVAAARALVAKAGDGHALLVDGPALRDEFAALRAAVAAQRQDDRPEVIGTI